MIITDEILLIFLTKVRVSKIMIYLLKLTVSLSLGNKLKVFEIMYVSGSHFVINK